MDVPSFQIASRVQISATRIQTQYVVIFVEPRLALFGFRLLRLPHHDADGESVGEDLAGEFPILRLEFFHSEDAAPECRRRDSPFRSRFGQLDIESAALQKTVEAVVAKLDVRAFEAALAAFSLWEIRFAQFASLTHQEYKDYPFHFV